jgi:hypothetical protein
MNMLYNPADPTGALAAGQVASQKAAADASRAAAEWKAYAQQLEKKAKELMVEVDARVDYSNELLDEAFGEKPKRLSLPENKPLRQQRRAQLRRMSAAKLIDVNPLNFKISD